MVDLSATIDRLRAGCVAKIRTERGGSVYIDCEVDHSNRVVEGFTVHVRHERELPYAYRVDGLTVAQTLTNNEFELLPPNAAEQELAVTEE